MLKKWKSRMRNLMMNNILAIQRSYVKSYYHTLEQINLNIQPPADNNVRLGSYRGPYDVSNGILTIPVKGLLLSKFSYQLGNLATGYEYIMAAYKKGMGDKKVKNILLDINSPGGSSMGLKELAQLFKAYRGRKMITAIVNYNAFSAGYFIAAQANQIIMQPSSMTGSIGVVATHFDYSGALEKEGVEVTFITGGEKKVDGNMYEPLSDSARNDIQEIVDKTYDYFVKEVSINRNLNYNDVANTEAGVFDAEDSIKNGLADIII